MVISATIETDRDAIGGSPVDNRQTPQNNIAKNFSRQLQVLTLMGKMETLRASVCAAQNKKPRASEDVKITLLKRGQESSVASDQSANPNDAATFDPATWKEDVKNLTEM